MRYVVRDALIRAHVRPYRPVRWTAADWQRAYTSSGREYLEGVVPVCVAGCCFPLVRRIKRMQRIQTDRSVYVEVRICIRNAAKPATLTR